MDAEHPATPAPSGHLAADSADRPGGPAARGRGLPNPPELPGGHSGRRHGPRDPTVHRITTAQQSLSADIRRRQRKYLLSNGLRVVCFVLAIVLRHSGPLFFGLIVGSLILPYVAVVVANAGRERDSPPPTAYAEHRRRELTAGDGDDGEDDDRVVIGEPVDAGSGGGADEASGPAPGPPSAAERIPGLPADGQPADEPSDDAGAAVTGRAGADAAPPSRPDVTRRQAYARARRSPRSAAKPLPARPEQRPPSGGERPAKNSVNGTGGMTAQ